MFSQLRPALVVFVLLTIVTGVFYPAAVTLIAQLVFPGQANGDILKIGGKPMGSEWIGQHFDRPEYFWGRPSATSPAYNGAASSGSNLGPTNPALFEVVKARIEQYRQADPGNRAPIPVELVTASGSGLDPHISPAAAEFQVERVARLRRVATDAIRKLVAVHTTGRTLGILGEPRVHVLKLNLALDAQAAGGSRAAAR